MSDLVNVRPPEDWVALYIEGQIPPGEEAAFNAWVQSDPGNLGLLVEQLELHGSLKARLEKADTRATGRIRMVRKARLTRRRVIWNEPRPWLWAVAGLIAVLAILPFVWQTGHRVKPAPEPVTRREPPPVDPEPQPVPPVPEPVRKPSDPATALEVPKPLPALPAPTPDPIVPPPPAPKQDQTVVSVAELKELKGGVLVGGKAARAGQGIAAGEGVETVGKEASAVIVFPDGTRLDLKGETQTRDLSVEKGKRLFLARGTLDARVAKQDQAMTLDTPQAETKVLGTILRLQVDLRAGSTLVEVEEGRVRLTRTTDQKAVEVAAGTYAVAAPGVDLKAKPIPKAVVLLSLDFEETTAPLVQTGKILPGPKRPGSNGCLAGVEVPADRLTRVYLADDRRGLFTLRDDAVLSFDYWVAERVEAVDIYVWDKNQRASIGGPSLLTLTKEKWTRVTIPFSEFVSKAGQRLQDGDVLTQLTIQTGGTNGGGPLFVDNVDVTVVRKK